MNPGDAKWVSVFVADLLLTECHCHFFQRTYTQGKPYSFKIFLFLGGCFAFVAVWWTRQSVKQQPPTLLPREVTEEWKGGMQTAILLCVHHWLL